MSEHKETTINKFIKHFNRNFRKEKHTKKEKKSQSTKGNTTGIENKNKTVVLAGHTTSTTQNPASQNSTAKTAAKVVYSCHRGNVPMSQLGQAYLYAGGWTRGADSKNCAVIDLTGTEYGWGQTVSVQAENDAGKNAFRRTLESLNIEKQKDNSLAWISMPIRDYGTPRWERATWVSLACDIMDIMKSGTNVLIACTGGHGRTGLALSIVLYLLAIVPENENPVEYVRKHYCIDAVETSAQENYVYRILALPFTAKTYDVGKYNKDYWSNGYDDDYRYLDVRRFDYCSVCGQYRWTTDGICDKCADEIEADVKSIDLDKKPVIKGTCLYCGDSDVSLIDHNGEMICSKCEEWSKLRAKEFAKKNHTTSLCKFCGDNIDNPFLYYNSDLICERCYVDLYGSGMISEVITDSDKNVSRIQLSTPKKGESK